MTEEPELPLAGLDAERPLPSELQARLEAALLAAVAGGLPVPADAWGLHQPPGTDTDSLDAPRPLPEPLRARLESVLLAAAAATPTATTPAAAASPTPELVGTAATASPSGLAGAPAGATVVPLERRRRKVVAAWSSVAAVLLMVVAVAGLAGRGGDSGSGSVEVAGGPTSTTVETPASLPSDAGVSPEPIAPPTTEPAATPRTTRPPRPLPTTTGPPTPSTRGTEPPTVGPTGPPAGSTEPSGGGTQPAPASTDPGPPPPFYDSPPGGGSSTAIGQPAPAAPSGDGSQGAAPPNESQKSGAPMAGGAALRVGVVTGDKAQEDGFRAYIDRLNQNGGVRGHRIDLVTVSPAGPSRDTIATVNLSPHPVAGPGGAPGWATGPLLETLTATENLLPANGAVFSFASPPERQGHLAADALFPSAAPGQKAVIYTPASPGPLRDVVPGAIEAVLKQRGVIVEIETYDPNSKKRFTSADAAFVSLDPAAAKAWVAQAKTDNYRPARGIGGIYSLFDETLLADLPEGARVVSPYVTPAGDEGQAIRSAGGGSTSASVLHGWATAKSLAAAIWRTDADTPAEVQAALEGLSGWSSGLAPPYETRPNTRSRTPEGVVFRVQDKAFVPDGGFRKDPH